MPVEIPIEKWSGAIHKVTLGATPAEGGTRTHTVVVGGEKSLPFLHFEGEIPCRPVIAVEITDFPPETWAQPLLDAWGDVVCAPANTLCTEQWARAGEKAGADVVALSLSPNLPDGSTANAETAVQAVKAALSGSGLPLIVFGPDQPDLDNELLVAVAEAAQGERLLLATCEDKNYRTIVATAIANGHNVSARSPMDVNLAKQLSILITDMGMPPDRIVIDPTVAALGYGLEYGYSVMERIRITALQGDAMIQMPMMVTAGLESWKVKESKVGSGVPQGWGEWVERAINWETMTSLALIESGADIVVVRHPESVKRIQSAIEQLMAAS